MKNKKSLIPFIIMLISSVLLGYSFFLPYTTAEVSLIDFFKKYKEISGDTNYSGEIRTLGIVCSVLISAIVIIAFFVVLCSLLRAPIATIIFTVLDFLAHYALAWDFKDRRVVGGAYKFDTGYYVLQIALLLILGAAISMLVFRIMEKREKKKAEALERSQIKPVMHDMDSE